MPTTHRNRVLEADPTQLKAVKIALVGNPNAGKTTLYNALTGSRQKVGNYPGVTVERVEGTMLVKGDALTVIDVPGLYSFTPISTDEEVALAELVSDDAPDCLIYALDASNLERNLFLYSQLAERSTPIVIALTMVDMLESEGHTIDVAKLQSLLGCPVIRVTGHKGVGVDELKEAVLHQLENPVPPSIELGYPPLVQEATGRLVEHMARSGIELARKEARCLILEESCEALEKFENTPEHLEAIQAEKISVLGKNIQGKTIDAQARYSWANRVKRESITETDSTRRSITEKIDWLLTHRVFGLLVFLGVMYLVFQSIYTFAAPLMDLIEAGKELLAGWVHPMLASMPMVQSLVVDGLIEGIGSVIVFLPQIIILFFFIAVLEGTGYLARAAFLMDRLLGWCGLNGRAFIPLLSSFACAIPGVMAARVMPDQKSRLLTVLVAPLMSCSARLPVYLLLIGAVIEPKYGPVWAGISLFAMHFVGLIVAIPVVFILNRGVVKGKRLPFMLELPKYQWPRWKDVMLTLKSRAQVFLTTAGTIIFAMTVIIWALLYFPQQNPQKLAVEYSQLTPAQRSDESLEEFSEMRQQERSLLGQFGKTIEPVFVPAGFDWRLTTSILAAFPAREVVVPAMGIIFGTGSGVDETSETLHEKIASAKWPDGRQLMTPWTAVSMMVFFALCSQCMATLAAIKRETNSWKWSAFSFTYMTVLAYIFSVLVQQIGRFFS